MPHLREVLSKAERGCAGWAGNLLYPPIVFVLAVPVLIIHGIAAAQSEKHPLKAHCSRLLRVEGGGGGEQKRE